jgi:hypothetical protein
VAAFEDFESSVGGFAVTVNDGGCVEFCLQGWDDFVEIADIKLEHA